MLYIWYSSATDKTGKNIVNFFKEKAKIKVQGVTTKPVNLKKGDIILGWGAKVKNVILPKNITVYNHPNNIKLNRNKAAALQTLYNKQCNIGKVSYKKSSCFKELQTPFISRPIYHQGGKDFRLILNKHMDLGEGTRYFREFIDIKTEYRLHVVKNTVIYAIKKVKQSDPQKAFIDHYSELIKHNAQSKSISLNDPTLTFALQYLAKRLQTFPNEILRSHSTGWKFSKVTKYDNDLGTLAIKAINALGLDFGAVDCAITHDNSPIIIEVNTGPGLDGTVFTTWCSALNNLINGTKITSKINTKINNDNIVNDSTTNILKTTLKTKLNSLLELLDVAETENEINVIQGLVNKLNK